MDGDEAMVTDDAIGGTAAQQHEVRTRTQGACAVAPVGRWGHRRTSGRLCVHCLLITFFETAQTRCGVGVCGVCALGRERWWKETTTAFPGDVCVSRLCSQDVGTGGVAPTEGVTVPLPGDASATDSAADAVRAAATVLLLGVGEGAASGG
eukprot:2980011-Prymnesium_polylepis.1